MRHWSLTRGRAALAAVGAAAVAFTTVAGAGATASPAVTRVAPGASALSVRPYAAASPAAALDHALGRTRTARAALAGPLAAERRSGDGIDLVAPPNGSSQPDTAPITFQWYEGWYCAGCDGVIVLLLATDPQLNNVVYAARGTCPASSSPSCPTTVTAGPFPPGTYYWAIGVKLGENPTHVSDLWSFTVTHAGAPATPTTPAPGTSFTDATGDGNGAPDITGVNVANDANGQIQLNILIPSSSVLASDELVLAFLDTDQNPATGAPSTGGADYLLIGATDGWGIGQWNGTQFAKVSAPSASAQYSGGPQFSINRTDLGNTSGFNFWVATAKGQGDGAPFDEAPDNGVWNYKLAGVGGTPSTPSAPGPLTPPSTPTAAKVVSIRVLALPAAPTAGLQFRILVPSVALSTGANVRPTTFRCAAKIAGHALVGRAAGRCTYTIPRGAGGSVLTVTVTVMYRGEAKSRTLSFRIRRP